MSQTVPDSSQQIRILIADDHPVVRKGLVAILDDQADLIVVAEANDGREAIELFRLYQPDVAIIDLCMPHVSGVEATTTIRAEFPKACIIMLTIYDTDEDIYQGLRAGAKAYLLKDTSCSEIVEIIRAVCQGQRYIPSAIGKQLAARIEQPQLSDRETEILQLIATGKGNKAISNALGITENTVKFHVNNILGKLQASNRTQAVVLALKLGLVKLRDS